MLTLYTSSFVPKPQSICRILTFVNELKYASCHRNALVTKIPFHPPSGAPFRCASVEAKHTTRWLSVCVCVRVRAAAAAATTEKKNRCDRGGKIGQALEENENTNRR